MIIVCLVYFRKEIKCSWYSALKHAGGLISNVLETIDSDSDGEISYEGACRPAHFLQSKLILIEFQSFVKQTEAVLKKLFYSIDHNRDGKLEKQELKSAFKTAGLTVSNRKLDQFFSQVDTNNDGVVSYEEWR